MATLRTAATTRVTALAQSIAPPLRHILAAIAVEVVALLAHVSIAGHVALAAAEVCVLWLWWRRHS